MSPVSSLWCFQCGAEYEDTVETCLECGIRLVPDRPLEPDDVGGADEDQMAYELHDWAFESRRMLDQLLTSQSIPHAWQGASVIVRAADEEVVDGLIEEVEHATLPTLDPDLEHTVYEMADWSPEQQTRLSNMLGPEDEQSVDAVLDRLEAAIGLDGDESGELQLDDGLAVNDTLSEAFLAADRLKDAPRNHDAVLQFVDAAELIEQMAPPYGFERHDWDDIRSNVIALLDALESEQPDDDEIAERARVVRTQLVRFI
jgi:hypothetical protein